MGLITEMSFPLEDNRDKSGLCVIRATFRYGSYESKIVYRQDTNGKDLCEVLRFDPDKINKCFIDSLLINGSKMVYHESSGAFTIELYDGTGRILQCDIADASGFGNLISALEIVTFIPVVDPLYGALMGIKAPTTICSTEADGNIGELIARIIKMGDMKMAS